MSLNFPINKLQDYNVWQQQLISFIHDFEIWLKDKQIFNNAHNLIIQQIFRYIKTDKINIACIAEFSRGKSELINALFFSEYGKRIIPTSSGRTTMCPTELMYNENEAIGIKLLPIETYLQTASTEDFFDHSKLWHSITFDIKDSEAIITAFDHLKDTIWVKQEDAINYGLYDTQDSDYHNFDEDGNVEISRWRHAIINFPHPLLKQGLVVVDTPGLNAIGSEPELALRLIPEAHIVLFMLAADTGVTKTDLELWLSHVQPHQHQSALIILNKIDTLLDPLKSAQEHQQEIHKQMVQTAKYFNISPEQIYPISAKNGLLAKINQDYAAYNQSGLAYLEEVLVTTLIPKRQSILLSKIEHIFINLLKMSVNQISKEKQDIIEQIMQLKSMGQKESQNINYTLKKLKTEKEDFNEIWINIQALRSIFMKQTNSLLNIIESQKIEENASEIRKHFETHKSTAILKNDISSFLKNINIKIQEIEQQMNISFEQVEVIIKKLNTDVGSQIIIPNNFNILEYKNSFKEIEEIYISQFSRFNFLHLDKSKLMQRFFDTIVGRLRQLFLNLGKDTDSWIKNLILPIEFELKNQEEALQNKLELLKYTAINPETITVSKDKLHKKLQECDESLQYLLERENHLGNLIQSISIKNDEFPDNLSTALNFVEV